MNTQRLLVAAALVSLTACEPKVQVSPVSSPVAANPNNTTPTPVNSDGVSPTPPASVATGDVFAKANNALSFSLYSKLRATPGSIAFSPMSAELALTMAWMGARGETAAQMQKALGYEVDAEHAAAASGSFSKSLTGPFTFRVANRMFGEKSFAFRPELLSAAQSTLGAPLEAMDFLHAPDASRKHINDWVSGVTEKRISNLLPEGSISERTKLTIVNAVYFLGEWASAFKKQDTVAMPFHTSKTEQHPTDTMHQTLTAGYSETAQAQVLDLVYKGNTLAMTLVLPKGGSDLDALEASLSPSSFGAWVGDEKNEEVNVSLPKFTIETAPMDLGAALLSMGMIDAFNPNKADFTGFIAPGANAADSRSLAITAVVQKAFLKVDEKGTEAAAATAIVIGTTSVSEPKVPKEFKADHPFLFFLRDRATNTILFAGRVTDPR
jgi:serpin B